MGRVERKGWIKKGYVEGVVYRIFFFSQANKMFLSWLEVCPLSRTVFLLNLHDNQLRHLSAVQIPAKSLANSDSSGMEGTPELCISHEHPGTTF